MKINIIKSFVLAAALCLPSAASAQMPPLSEGSVFSVEDSNGEIFYEVVDEANFTCQVWNDSQDLNRYQGDIVVPSTVKYWDYEYTVTGVGEGGFRDCQNLHSVKLPSTVTSLGLAAFARCPKLVSVEFSSVTAIPDYAFSECPNLTDVSMPEILTSIGEGAFEDCTSLTGIAIPDGVKELRKKLSTAARCWPT